MSFEDFRWGNSWPLNFMDTIFLWVIALYSFPRAYGIKLFSTLEEIEFVLEEDYRSTFQVVARN